ncbi:ABC transporter permease subunit [Ruminococcaceae bacterium OttesenSCG-928-A11]|nr:ABC transporter permease subunit [Ruminococcaceae bacterium OttesenSCG-928-A11]
MALSPSKRITPHRPRRQWSYFFLALPLMLLLVLVSYVPIGGWIVSLFDYRPGIPLFQSRFVGLELFKEIFRDRDILRALKNTVVFSGIQFVLQPLPMLFAIALSEISLSKYRRLVQTMTTLPHFISWVIVYALCFGLFSANGLVNSLAGGAGAVRVLDNAGIVYTFQSALFQWKDLGWNAIIYIAAIAGIDQQQYEAALIDGAGRLRSAWHITVPNLMPTFLVLALLNVAGFINTGYEQYFVFKNALVMNKIEVLDLYIYRMGLQLGDYSYATAVGILKSAVSLTMLFAVNALAKRVRGESLI